MSRIVPNILVVEDDDAFRTILVSAFRDRGYEAEGVADAASAIRAAERDSPEMAVVDLRLPDQSGLDVVKALKEIDSATAIVVLTGYGSIATALESVRLGATHYLTKPTDADRILAAFQHGLALAAARPAERSAVAGAGGMGTPQPCPDRLRRQYLRGRPPARHAPPIAAAKAGEIPDGKVT